ncbi:methyltransferase [Haloimpatiens massiliensis]|uniref:methyltransferase n=1 Tax=Haloimpatiens massiliensis TaxID=1658110 RepID=UPI001FA9028C|nr:methyltransferase [Haloimpatiens massiliensis]
MKNIEVNESSKEPNTRTKVSKKDSCSEHHGFQGTSTFLNRDYYIKVGKADSLLKEINIMTKDSKIKNDKIRKYNQIDHYVELLDSIFDKLDRNNKKGITILDCGCGKSYLSFVLNYYLTEVKKLKCHFIGLDYSKKDDFPPLRYGKSLIYK